MRLPKTIIIAGKDWTVKTDKKFNGGWFNGGKAIMCIGTRFKKDIANIFLHEVIEAILTERAHRYKIYDDEINQNFLFNLNHSEFDNVIFDITLALKSFLK